MDSLKTSFAGLELANPIIIGSCSRTADPHNILRLEEAGAAAIVMKSMFEENIVRQTQLMSDDFGHSEEADYLQGYIRSQMLKEYLDSVEETKKLCSIPVIASINCYSAGEWQTFARLIEQAGADAIELNVMSICTSTEYDDGDFERRHTDIADAVRQRVKIPVTMKLGINLSNPVNVISRLHAHGVQGMVLFNRFYQPDMDIESMEYVRGEIFSSPTELAWRLRWTGIASAAVEQPSYAVSGGVSSGADVVRALLAGASAVQVCTAIYRHGNSWIRTALDDIAGWQRRHGFSSPKQYRGRMNAADSDNAEQLDRVQYLRYFDIRD